MQATGQSLYSASSTPGGKAEKIFFTASRICRPAFSIKTRPLMKNLSMAMWSQSRTCWRVRTSFSWGNGDLFMTDSIAGGTAGSIDRAGAGS